MPALASIALRDEGTGRVGDGCGIARDHGHHLNHCATQKPLFLANSERMGNALFEGYLHRDHIIHA